MTFTRDLTLQDITEMVFISAKAGVLHYKLLADARTAPFALLPSDTAGFKDLLHQIAAKSRLGQTAVVVADDVGLGIAEGLSQIASGFCVIRGFLLRDEAERWLGWQT